jgi:N utilization substance protein A
VVKLGENLALLPNSLKVPSDNCVVGYSIRALLKNVFLEPKNEYQLILDRASEDFLRALFELEIPEVFEKLVEIKKVARIAGYKSKIAVVSNDSNVDPVGTCVGVGGARIKPILKELGGEKIDVIEWSDELAVFVKASLKPAEVKRVELANGQAYVFVDSDQRSLAIGKMGNNISLATQLTGVSINLVQQEQKAESDVEDNEATAFDQE